MIAVIGAGLMGAATAWRLARDGHDTTLIEAFTIGHRRGSSHGTSRIYRRAYADPLYTHLTGQARELWHELEDDTGAHLLRLTGALDFGAARDPQRIAAHLAGAGVPHQLLTASQASERWPQFRFAGVAGPAGLVLHHPDAGTVNADATVAAATRRAAQLGARVLTGVSVTGVDVLPQGGVVVRTDDPGTPEVRADAAVVAVGPWLPDLAAHLGVPVRLPPLTVTQQQVFHFRQRDPDAQWPVFVHQERLDLYGLPSGADGGPAPAIKVAQHNAGTPTTARTRSGVVDPASRDVVTAWVARTLPGLDPTPVAEATCLYTRTPDEDFILDRVGPVVIASPCSGHGAKFTPLIGRMAASLALGQAEPHPRFALGSPPRTA